MNTYHLENKLQITKDFLAELEAKSWQEIDQLQTQIANIDSSDDNNYIVQLLNNLLTSYYIFVGGLENFSSNTKSDYKVKNTNTTNKETSIENNLNIDTEELAEKNLDNEVSSYKDTVVEPFEYFVDFDEPSGEPLTDEDLYG
jgi:hypothetical protein